MGKKTRQQSGSSPKVPLLDSEEWLSAPLLRALQTIFERFDAGGDGTLNEAELQAFARACNDGTELDADELDQIQDYFDTDDSGALTLRGFHEMYHMQTRSRSAPAPAVPALTASALHRRCASPPPPLRQPSALSARTDPTAPSPPPCPPLPCQPSALSARTEPTSVRAYRPSDTWKDMRALGFNDQLEVVDAAAPAAAAASATAAAAATATAAATASDPKAAAAPPAGLDAAGAGQAPSADALAVAVSGGEAGARSIRWRYSLWLY